MSFSRYGFSDCPRLHKINWPSKQFGKRFPEPEKLFEWTKPSRTQILDKEIGITGYRVEVAARAAEPNTSSFRTP